MDVNPPHSAEIIRALRLIDAATFTQTQSDPTHLPQYATPYPSFSLFPLSDSSALGRFCLGEIFVTFSLIGSQLTGPHASDGSSHGWRAPAPRNMVLGDACRHTLVDSSHVIDERSGSVPDDYALAALLQFPGRIRQVSGSSVKPSWPLSSLCEISKR